MQRYGWQMRQARIMKSQKDSTSSQKSGLGGLSTFVKQNENHQNVTRSNLNNISEERGVKVTRISSISQNPLFQGMDTLPTKKRQASNTLIHNKMQQNNKKQQKIKENNKNKPMDGHTASNNKAQDKKKNVDQNQKFQQIFNQQQLSLKLGETSKMSDEIKQLKEKHKFLTDRPTISINKKVAQQNQTDMRLKNSLVSRPKYLATQRNNSNPIDSVIYQSTKRVSKNQESGNQSKDQFTNDSRIKKSIMTSKTKNSQLRVIKKSHIIIYSLLNIMKKRERIFFCKLSKNLRPQAKPLQAGFKKLCHLIANFEQIAKRRAFSQIQSFLIINSDAQIKNKYLLNKRSQLKMKNCNNRISLVWCQILQQSLHRKYNKTLKNSFNNIKAYKFIIFNEQKVSIFIKEMQGIRKNTLVSAFNKIKQCILWSSLKNQQINTQIKQTMHILKQKAIRNTRYGFLMIKQYILTEKQQYLNRSASRISQDWPQIIEQHGQNDIELLNSKQYYLSKDDSITKTLKNKQVGKSINKQKMKMQQNQPQNLQIQDKINKQQYNWQLQKLQQIRNQYQNQCNQKQQKIKQLQLLISSMSNDQKIINSICAQQSQHKHNNAYSSPTKHLIKIYKQIIRNAHKQEQDQQIDIQQQLSILKKQCNWPELSPDQLVEVQKWKHLYVNLYCLLYINLLIQHIQINIFYQIFVVVAINNQSCKNIISSYLFSYIQSQYHSFYYQQL